jgi:membrane associated rhomboid family serine protease
MDWSLALISQGIESIISRSDEGHGWLLQVSPTDYETALETIRLYQAENLGWGLRREILQPGLVFDWLSLLWVVLQCVFYCLNATWIDLRTPGILNTVALAHGQWWRLFTAIWLHADLAHLADNLVFGFVLLGLAMGRYGAGVSLLAAYLAGAGGNICSWAVAPQPRYGLGASGMVMGCLGLLAVPTLSLWRNTPHAGKSLLVGLIGAFLLFVLLGLTPGTDVVAHLGGFASGVLFASVMTRFARPLRKPLPNLISALSFLLLVLWPWWLSLRH